ncbi:MAG: methylmalonyl Co-A mutase-associated GTPase MeaB, partial [Sciscionella sp.]
GALRMLRGAEGAWTTPVLTCSALRGDGLDTVWSQVRRHREAMEQAGEFAAKRSRQQVDWTWSMVREQLLGRLRTHPRVRELVPELERAVAAGELPATLAAERILTAFQEG